MGGRDALSAKCAQEPVCMGGQQPGHQLQRTLAKGAEPEYAQPTSLAEVDFSRVVACVALRV